jgi:hypothetical protein
MDHDKINQLIQLFQERVESFILSLEASGLDSLNEMFTELGYKYTFSSHKVYGTMLMVHPDDSFEDVRILNLFDRYGLNDRPLDGLLLATIEDVYKAIDDLPQLEHIVTTYKEHSIDKVTSYINKLKND